MNYRTKNEENGIVVINGGQKGMGADLVVLEAADNNGLVGGSPGMRQEGSEGKLHVK